MSSSCDWRESYGDLRLLFFGAAGQIIDGNFRVQCPNCSKHTLRFYYHIFNAGTLWVWCPGCRVATHLPRVSPEGWRFPDPFQDLGLGAFADVETASSEPFVKRLDELWRQRAIGVPESLQTKSGEKRKPTET